MTQVDNQAGASDAWTVPEIFIDRFRRRATRLYAMAIAILVAIFALLVFGALVFVYASGIAARDLSRGEPGDVLSTELRKQNLLSEIGYLQKLIGPYQKEFDAGQRHLAEVLDLKRNLNSASGRLRIVDLKLQSYQRTGFISRLDSLEIPQELAIARETLAADVKILEAPSNNDPGAIDLDSVRQAMAETSADLSYVDCLISLTKPAGQANSSAEAPDDGALSPQTLQILQTNVTRFGTLLLVFFFIRIKLPIYRYFVSLGTFYSGQADALVLLKQTNQQDLAKHVLAMTPTLGIDKTPSTPIANVMQLAKEVAPQARR